MFGRSDGVQGLPDAEVGENLVPVIALTTAKESCRLRGSAGALRDYFEFFPTARRLVVVCYT